MFYIFYMFYMLYMLYMLFIRKTIRGHSKQIGKKRKFKEIQDTTSTKKERRSSRLSKKAKIDYKELSSPTTTTKPVRRGYNSDKEEMSD